MRLTSYHRDAFVTAVLDDVPMVDYDEQCRVLMQKWAIDRLPPKLRAMFKEFGHFFKTGYVSPPGDLSSVSVVTADSGSHTRAAMTSDTDFWSDLSDLAKAKKTQADVRLGIRNRVVSIINACSTVKQAHERLPKFAKYLPDADAPIDRTVPVVANLVADLTAAGWPKAAKARARREAA
ncbi:Nmad5 family putative nucleotide modification protein [Burkholderia alba]|uniref:Nmad5 family putative nucleotide modification protein n=1 Tax=Burkholderia alba TaxID=2683677 RepID=UPI002B05EC9C|nr:Nmad5 family putative nucleotide modification protein [Burkholderia alba]